MKKIKIIFASVGCLVAMMMLSACGHQHVWTEATCTSPKTCNECGEVEGNALGHTCEVGKCQSCGEFQGAETIEKITAKASKACEKITSIAQNGSSSLTSSMTNEKEFCDSIEATYKSYQAVISEFDDAADLCGDYEYLADLKKALYGVSAAFPTFPSVKNFDTMIEYSNNLVPFVNALSNVVVEAEALETEALK